MPAGVLAIETAFITVGSVILGHTLDGWLGTAPWLTMGLTTVGFLAGLVVLIRGLTRLQKDDEPPPTDPS